jgi:hypothetical protein
MTRTALGLAVVLAVAPGSALAQLVDTAVHPPVNYDTLLPPAVGETYIDPVFGTSIRRLSDAPHQANNANVGNLAFVVNEYATMSSFNQDGSRILLQHQSYFGLYDREGRYQEDLPFEISASTEPRWSRRDANLLYYVYGNTLKSYDVSTRTRAVVHTFTEYAKVSGRGESDLCFDGDHMAFVGDDREIFVYEIGTATKGPVLDASGHGFDSLYITPGDQVVVSWFQTGTARYAGIELYDRQMRFLRQLTTVNGHKDVGRDSDGSPIMLWINSADLQAPANCQNGLVKIRLSDGARTCVLSLDWSLAVHVSLPDGGDWAFISTYAPTNPSPALGQWKRYMNEVFQVRLDGSAVRRLAHHRSRPLNDYWYTPRASVSRDGQRLVYSSNYGLPATLPYAPAYVDTYLLEVDAGAASSTGSPSPIRTRYEQDDADVSYGGPWLPNARFFHSAGTAALAMDAGARATLAFSGTAVRWIGYRDEWSGLARVSIDGQLRSVVDTYATPFQAQAVLFSAADLAPGPHTLDIEATGTRSAASGGAWVWVDAFEVVRRAEQDDPAAVYEGAWSGAVSGTFSRGAAVSAHDAGARASFSFTGTAVSWIGSRDAGSGIARVLVDDVLRAEIDTFAVLPETQAVVYTLTGLAAGPHVLTIEATGRRHPLSLGDAVWVDAFETLPE